MGHSTPPMARCPWLVREQKSPSGPGEPSMMQDVATPCEVTLEYGKT